MSTELVDRLGAIFFILLGVGFAIFYKVIARYAVTMWQKKINMNPPSEWGYQVSFFIIGILFIIWGITSIFGIFK